MKKEDLKVGSIYQIEYIDEEDYKLSYSGPALLVDLHHPDDYYGFGFDLLNYDGDDGKQCLFYIEDIVEEIKFDNNCVEVAIQSLEYLAENPRPSGGQEMFNAEHLYQIAQELKRIKS